MPVRLFAHLSWTTDGRRALIGPREEEFLRQFLPSEARRHKARTIALGIVSDHIHVLLRLPPSIDAPKLVQQLKGASARLANKDRTTIGGKLKWAKGYDLRSVSPRNLAHATHYVQNQATRHPDRAIPKSPIQSDPTEPKRVSPLATRPSRGG